MARMDYEARRREELLHQPTCDELHARLLADEASGGEQASVAQEQAPVVSLDVPSLSSFLDRQPVGTTLTLTDAKMSQHRVHVHRRELSLWQLSAVHTPAAVSSHLPNRDEHGHTTHPVKGSASVAAQHANLLAGDVTRTVWSLSSRQ